MKKKLITLFSLILLAGAAISAEEKAIKILNETEYPIVEIYASPSESEEWGDNLLDEGTMIDYGESTTIQLDASVECYDFKLIDTDNDYYVKWEIDIGSLDEITFTFDDYDGGDEDYDDNEDYDDESGDYDSGWDDGYNSGYQEGYGEAFSEGYREAFKEAYKKGFEDGLETARAVD